MQSRDELALQQADRKATSRPAPTDTQRPTVPPNEEQLSTGEDASVFNEVFTTSRPSHLVSGLASGTWNVTKGVVLGAGSLVAAPISGYRQDGVKGMFTGIGQGLLAAVALPVAGIATGAQQVGLGAYNTVDYIKHSRDDKVYDQKQKCWVDRYRVLDEEYLERREAYQEYQKERSKSSNKGDKLTRRDSKPRTVADVEYYEVLQVPTDATQSEIRKAYYKLARECHPDKQKDDPDAKERFQRVGEAYQVLGDETRRDQYDKHGKTATEAMDFVDSSVFFAMLFGSEALEPYIGQLKLTCMLDADADGEGDIRGAVVGDPREQAYRRCHLAVQLRNRLQPGVAGLMTQGDKTSYVEWKTNQRKIADNLCKESFGAPLVDSIGFVYENYAEQFIGKKESFMTFGEKKAKFQHQKRQMTTLFSAIQAATRVAEKSRKAQKKAARRQRMETEEEAGTSKSIPTEDAMSEEEVRAMENSLGDIMETMLQLCLTDVNSTVRAAAKKTVNDRGIPAEERIKRAEALRDLGKIFQEAARAYSEANVQVAPHERMQNAFIKMAQKLDEQRYEKAPSEPSQ